jgi:hypothetical protein
MTDRIPLQLLKPQHLVSAPAKAGPAKSGSSVNENCRCLSGSCERPIISLCRPGKSREKAGYSAMNSGPFRIASFSHLHSERKPLTGDNSISTPLRLNNAFGEPFNRMKQRRTLHCLLEDHAITWTLDPRQFIPLV